MIQQRFLAEFRVLVQVEQILAPDVDANVVIGEEAARVAVVQVEALRVLRPEPAPVGHYFVEVCVADEDELDQIGQPLKVGLL